MSVISSTEACERGYQQDLAASLVSTIGIEGAARACRSNSRDGVLEKVLRHASEDSQKAANLNAATQSHLGARSSVGVSP